MDAHRFSAEFLKQKKVFLSESLIPKISDDDVKEILHKKNYYYEVVSSEIKKVQESILKEFLCLIEINSAATAFRKDYSYLNFLEPHRYGYHFLRLDISSFFHSIRYDDLKSIFSVYFKDEPILENSTINLLDLFLSYVTFSVPNTSSNVSFRGHKILPIGFITSPAISNIFFRAIDIQIQEFCQSKGVVYSRYADDMLFSSGPSSKYVHSEGFEKEISILIDQFKLKINKRKTIRRSNTISLNGYSIKNSSSVNGANFVESSVSKNQGIWVSNKKTKNIDKILFMLKNNVPYFEIMKKTGDFNVKSKFSSDPINKKLLDKYAKDQLLNRLNGYRSYLLSFIIFHKSHKCISLNALKKYQTIIDGLEKYINLLG